MLAGGYFGLASMGHWHQTLACPIAQTNFFVSSTLWLPSWGQHVRLSQPLQGYWANLTWYFSALWLVGYARVCTYISWKNAFSQCCSAPTFRFMAGENSILTNSHKQTSLHNQNFGGLNALDLSASPYFFLYAYKSFRPLPESMHSVQELVRAQWMSVYS